MTLTSDQRHLVLLSDGPDPVAETDEDWEMRHIAETRCPGCRRWRQDVPYAPIHAILRNRPKYLVSTTGLFQVVDPELVDAILPYGRGIITGTVRLARDPGLPIDLVTVYGQREHWLQADRGRYSRHNQCHVCGRVRSRNGWAHPVIVERYLDDRWLYLDSSDELFVDLRLVEKEHLRKRFPKLRFYPVPVVPEPLDGEVLPGDPGWTGTLVKQPLPAPPAHKPEKGIGLWL